MTGGYLIQATASVLISGAMFVSAAGQSGGSRAPPPGAGPGSSLQLTLEDAARAGATLAEQRLHAEQRRYAVGLSTTFLVTQAQRDLLQAQVNLLQATLDHQSSRVTFDALQLAPPLTPGETVGVRGTDIVRLPAPSPAGVFREER